MARGRYRSDALSAAGHGQKPPEAAPLEPSSESPQPPSTPDTEAKSEPAQAISSLKDQLAGMQRYASDPVEQYISFHFPGALPGERQWLRANQHHLANPALIHSAAAIALQRGCPRGSPEFMQFCNALLDQHHAAMQAHAAPPPAEPMPEPTPVHEPMHEPVTIDLEKTEGPEGEADEDHRMASFFAAPPSRSGSYATEPELTPSGSVRLSKAEIEHAQAAGVSVEEYGRQKLRMLQMKKSKLIRDE
jgi:hypothetical protein